MKTEGDLMKFVIRGQKLKVTEAIKTYIEQKVGKLDKYFESPDDLTAHVLIKVRGSDQMVEVTIPTKKAMLRAEESHNDLYASIDLVIEKLERQIRKNKTKMQHKKVKHAYVDFDMSFDVEHVENDSKIVKRKSLDVKPMNEEEALLQMELINHDFFVFKNIDEDCFSVLYVRKDGHYGLINIK